MDIKVLRAGGSRRVRAGICVGVIGLTALASTAVITETAPASSASTMVAGHGGNGPAPVVNTAAGAVSGKTVGKESQFLGIPYAAPPVGALRWHAPQPAASWKGVRSATKFGPNCAQPATPFGLASTSENCLYLNVFAPSGRTQHSTGRPVLVWIHGGGLRVGESNDYVPSQLVADGTVVVTINFREGALGFLAHPALAGQGGSSGNYGLMDQQAALRWVQRNISSFGGNPRNVTIGGESSGGLSVLAQVASPGAHGLFERAIVQSGAFALTQTPLATAEAAGKAFATKAGCPDQSAACLRKLPVSTILKDQDNQPYGYTPGVVDGKVLTQSIGTALASGKFNRVPILDGSNLDESRLFVAISQLTVGAPVTAATYLSAISSTLGVSAAQAPAIAAKYPLSAYPSAPIALSTLDTDAIFACPALTVDKTVSKFVPTFGYEFNDVNAPELYLPPVTFPYGAAHESELQYLFDLPTTPSTAALTARQQQLASSMQHYWASFAANGSPSTVGQPAWPAFHGGSETMMSLLPPRPQVETDFATVHKCGFWDNAG